MQTLDDLGLADNTLVILSADHGGIAKYTDMDPLRGGKGALYEGGIRVSTCMRWPGVIPAGTTCDVPIYGIDFMPTLVEVTSGTLPEHQPVDGESLIPLFSGATSLKCDTLYWHFLCILEVLIAKISRPCGVVAWVGVRVGALCLRELSARVIGN